MNSQSVKNKDLEGKKIVITGGTSGMGKAMATLLSEHGAQVLIVGRDKQKIDKISRNLGKKTKIIGIAADLKNEKEVRNIFDTAVKEFGGLDILVNNAGVGGGNFLKESEEEWKESLETNLYSYVVCSKYASKIMMEKKNGHIIFIGSMSANTRDSGSDVYNAGKAGVQAFSESLRKTLNPYDIKISLIEPGNTATGMQSENENEQKKMIKKGVNLKPEFIAKTVLFCITQPKFSDVFEVKIKPLHQYI